MEVIWHITDGDRVVFTGLRPADGKRALYSVLANGPTSSAVRLSHLLEPLGWIPGVSLSPDQSRVVFGAWTDAQEVSELFSAPIAGPTTATVRLNMPLPPGGDVGTSRISPDSTTVVYSAEQITDGLRELFSVPIGGPATSGTKLNKPLVSGFGAFVSGISADSNWVVYYADQETTSVLDLFRVPIHGPAAVGEKLSDTLAPGESVWRPRISSTDRVVYIAQLQGDSGAQLYSVSLFGPPAARVKINPDLGTNGSVPSLFQGQGFEISPDGSQVAYRADNANLPMGDDVFRLWTVPISGPGDASVLRGATPVTGGDVHSFSYAPDGQHIVYIADQETDGVDELYVTYNRAATRTIWRAYK
jgi:Tol biopolymer transport system component